MTFRNAWLSSLKEKDFVVMQSLPNQFQFIYWEFCVFQVEQVNQQADEIRLWSPSNSAIAELSTGYVMFWNAKEYTGEIILEAPETLDFSDRWTSEFPWLEEIDIGQTEAKVEHLLKINRSLSKKLNQAADNTKIEATAILYAKTLPRRNAFGSFIDYDDLAKTLQTFESLGMKILGPKKISNCAASIQGTRSQLCGVLKLPGVLKLWSLES